MMVSSIPEFYSNRSVLITGATGFIGKVLLEKLARSCPNTKHFYILIRTKKGQDTRQRLQELQNSKAFDNLRKNPEVFQKFIGINGDVAEPGLQLSAADEKILIDNVSIVFHCAATVSFNEHLKKAVKMNLVATQQIVDLCRKMRNLEAFIHVSTAYCHCHKDSLDETIWPMSPSPTQLIESLRWMDDEMIQLIHPKLLDNRPNTYTYSKAMAESFLEEQSGLLPIAIIRPSIVEASWMEPFPGWLDSLNSTAGIALGGMKGVIRSAYCLAEKNMDSVPVDVCVNLMIAVAWYTATVQSNGIRVYNCTSGDINGHTWGCAVNQGIISARQVPPSNVMWYPTLRLQRSKWQHNLFSLFVHWLPSLCLDVVSILTGNKAIMLNIHQKIKKVTDSMDYFVTREWRFKAKNLWTVWERMSEEDRMCFNFDIREIHWPTFYHNFCLGVRTYILKEDLSTLPEARRHLKRMYYIQRLSILIGLLALGLLARFIFQLIFQ